MPRPLIATISIAAMRHNLTVAKSLHPDTKLWAVIKAHAYGHGLENGMRGFEAADGLALIELESAVQLRAWGWKKPILLLEGFFEPTDLLTVVQHGLEICIHCDEQIAMLERAKLSLSLSSLNLNVHLKMNTGMNRLGFMPTAYAMAYRRLRAIPSIRNITFMTHFANADVLQDPRLPVAEQWRRFQSGIADISDREQTEQCVANSAIHMLHPEIKSDWARPGIMLYGFG
jgi:alanine racemase